MSSGHDTVMAVDGEVTDQLVAYQEARAAGGAGLIVAQVAGVHATAKYTSHVLMADDDSCIPGLTRLADAVNTATARPSFQQLFHDGREMMESEDGTMPVALAPSAVPERAVHVMPSGDAARPRARDRAAATRRRPHGSARPGSTASRSSPRTATCRPSS